jgi:hypothetical protein
LLTVAASGSRRYQDGRFSPIVDLSG